METSKKALTRKEILEKYGHMITSEEVLNLAEMFCKLTKAEQSVILEVAELTTNNPARQKFAENWKGSMKDLPAALAQI